MTTYKAQIPLPLDIIRVSQKDILDNFSSANTTMDKDHYPFDAALNTGKHKTVTTPPLEFIPDTATDEPKFYGFKTSNATGVLQFSRLGSDAVPTPITHLSSGETSLKLKVKETSDIIDFKGMGIVIGEIWMYNSDINSNIDNPNLLSVYGFVWNGKSIKFQPIAEDFPFKFFLIPTATNSVMKIINNPVQGNKTKLKSVFWELFFKRLS